MPFVRGDVYRFHRRAPSGHEVRGHRFAVVVHASRLDHLSTWIVAPTSTTERAAPAVFRPEVTLLKEDSRVLCEHLTAVDPERLGPSVGYLSHAEMTSIDLALRLLLDLAP